MAATSAWQRALRAFAALLPGRRTANATQLAGLVGGMLASGGAQAVTLPEDRAEAMIHAYDGGGVRATGPALLVRKSLADRVTLSGTYYVDMVSNASIDVVTTASPFKETRSEFGLGLDYAYRDSLVTLSATSSSEPDYKSDSVSLDVSQEVFGGMTAVSLGFTRGSDKVGQAGTPGFFDSAKHWKYRLGVTQIVTPTWLMSANLEAISDDGYLGSPYRVARVFGAAVPERVPRTRSSRAVKLRSISEVVPGTALRAEYRYFWDNWDIRAHTAEIGATRHLGDAWLGEGFLRVHKQKGALFYSDNAASETTYVSRNRQLSDFNNFSVGTQLSYLYARVPGKYEIRADVSYEFVRFKFSEFTDIRNGQLYSHDANVMQLYVSATF